MASPNSATHSGLGLTNGVAWVGGAVIDATASFGAMSIFFVQTLSWLVRRWPSRPLLVASLYQIGVRSVPVICLTGGFIGMVLAVQSYYQFRTFGMESRLGVMINLSMYRELGPVLAATMLAGRVGSAIAAELGTMKVTEQIDALASMGASPIQHLVAPRFLACLTMIPLLTIAAVAMGVLGGAFYCIYVFGVDPYFYLQNAQQGTSSWDIVYGVIKSFFFGGAIAIISCYRGFHSSAGAEGVGRAATISFVQSFVTILVLDLFLSIGLDRLHDALWGQGAVV
ncbi:ABC transport permease subunit MlaE [Botrimarina colliarenosi]|uniref:ABC transport permease subunit MlaE n=1 Tax=Botrimarina colliarenosi TaxID=2528001 RepID=A0A5C6AKN3_9BACT|nr:ABC transporter permease [Botrimarina colliarenosi]TWT99581.1 ABC transport permease subunit MlaE [Botrimarina colliarenosi]